MKHPVQKFVLFGATGDLSQRMVWPSLYHLCREKLVPPTLTFVGSARNPMPGAAPLTFLSEVTHWWDASEIYGSDQQTLDRLRRADGSMRIEGDLLPLHPLTRVEDSGFTRNWWVGLALIHTLFVRHHNYICEVLKHAHPGWSGDQLFHTARLVNAAIMAKIHTVEWTPAVLPNPKVVQG